MKKEIINQQVTKYENKNIVGYFDNSEGVLVCKKSLNVDQAQQNSELFEIIEDIFADYCKDPQSGSFVDYSTGDCFKFDFLIDNELIDGEFVSDSESHPGQIPTQQVAIESQMVSPNLSEDSSGQKSTVGSLGTSPAIGKSDDTDDDSREISTNDGSSEFSENLDLTKEETLELFVNRFEALYDNVKVKIGRIGNKIGIIAVTTAVAKAGTIGTVVGVIVGASLFLSFANESYYATLWYKSKFGFSRAKFSKPRWNKANSNYPTIDNAVDKLVRGLSNLPPMSLNRGGLIKKSFAAADKGAINFGVQDVITTCWFYTSIMYSKGLIGLRILNAINQKAAICFENLTKKMEGKYSFENAVMSKGFAKSFLKFLHCEDKNADFVLAHPLLSQQLLYLPPMNVLPFVRQPTVFGSIGPLMSSFLEMTPSMSGLVDKYFPMESVVKSLDIS